MERVVKVTDKIEDFLELGGVKKEITVLVISGISLLLSIFHVFPRLPFDIAWAVWAVTSPSTRRTSRLWMMR